MAEQEMFDVVGIGCTTVDMLALVDPYPQPDQKVMVQELSQQGGGLVSTGLVAVARLGGKARYLGKIGDSELSNVIRHEFEREGVDISGLLTEPGESCLFTYIISTPSDGTRTCLVDMTTKPEFPAADLRKEDVLSGRFLFVDGFEADAALQAAQWATEAGRKILIDAEFIFERTSDLVAISDYVIASIDFAETRTGEKDAQKAADALYQQERDNKPGKVVIVTAGTRGSFGVTAEGRFHQPAFVVDVVDTTGAGDVYHGAFLYALAQEWPLPQCARFASAVAALKCRKLGGRAGIPTRDEVDAFLGGDPATHPPAE